ncbi:hypothetical protein SAMN05192539_10837 [Paraburkholderia diazotrophica]|uniref:Uncharacterized protein n=1 Tax=Paraburkholderia diazotrophica TaxID=667676 RepID=A0A1H7EPZ5_9BURK|nr:hypothetical protein SAMN05192539_10837 [Paraburkholderia diazotrophica]
MARVADCVPRGAYGGLYSQVFLAQTKKPARRRTAWRAEAVRDKT